MTPDDFPDVTPTNRYHMQRPKEAFGSMAEASLGSSEEADEEVQPTMQLRCELQILNTGGSFFTSSCWQSVHMDAVYCQCQCLDASWQPLIFAINICIRFCTGIAAF